MFIHPFSLWTFSKSLSIFNGKCSNAHLLNICFASSYLLCYHLLGPPFPGISSAPANRSIWGFLEDGHSARAAQAMRWLRLHTRSWLPSSSSAVSNLLISVNGVRLSHYIQWIQCMMLHKNSSWYEVFDLTPTCLTTRPRHFRCESNADLIKKKKVIHIVNRLNL